ncbi:MAG: hypothetical protein KGZ83_05460, partial [Sulfuricella sp.]|nr:hypothetical protein [Sulfuricella sp.]
PPRGGINGWQCRSSRALTGAPGFRVAASGLRWGFLALVFILLAFPSRAAEPLWRETDAHGQAVVHLYFFWSKNCPHCLVAKPYVEGLAARTPWLKLHSAEIVDHPENRRRYVEMAEALGQEAQSVPGFFVCGEMTTGFLSENESGADLLRRAEACRQGDVPIKQSAPIAIPGFGTVDAEAFSLPALTAVIAGLDAFNPCAFFVLLFLLSLLVHARDRGKMVLVGGVFVFFSGLIYFLFMAAWLNVFLILEELRYVTLGAGLVAVAVALINIKDFFWFKAGVSLSIPDRAKPLLYQRMRNLVGAARWPSVLVGTAALAIVANAYELLCTAGFPMVYTRILTLRGLSAVDYTLWLALYNVVYVIPLGVIVAVFTFTLGGRKLQEREGRLLKLLSGNMMLGLGLALLFAPQLLNNLAATALLLGLVGILSGAMVWLERHLPKKA